MNDTTESFIRSASYEWQGKPLKPFSAMRQAVAQRCGLKFGSLTAEEVQQSKVKGIYDGFFFDTVLVLFLCLSSESQVMKGFRDTDSLIASAMKWADEQGMTLGSQTFFDGAKIFMEIMGDLADSSFEIERGGGEAEPDPKD